MRNLRDCATVSGAWLKLELELWHLAKDMKLQASDTRIAAVESEHPLVKVSLWMLRADGEPCMVPISQCLTSENTRCNVQATRRVLASLKPSLRCHCGT